jgi:hypothetical protein
MKKYEFNLGNKMILDQNKKIKDLEKIIKIQERTIAAEKIVSNRLFKKWFDQEQIITDWRYSYWKLERKFAKAVEDVKSLNHYIEQKTKKNSSLDERTESNQDKSDTNITQKKKK